MRMSELISKRIINLFDGGFLGVIGDSDLIIDPDSGDIESLLVPNRQSGFGNHRQERKPVVIPWESVRKVGSEVIVVDTEEPA